MGRGFSYSFCYPSFELPHKCYSLLLYMFLYVSACDINNVCDPLLVAFMHHQMKASDLLVHDPSAHGNTCKIVFLILGGLVTLWSP